MSVGVGKWRWLGSDCEPLHASEDDSGVAQHSHQGRSEGDGKHVFRPVEPSYLDMYRSGALSIHLHFGVIEVAGRRGVGEYCVVFEKRPGRRSVNAKSLAVHYPLDDRILKTRAHRKKLPMLIRIFETAQEPERIRFGCAASVRLQRYDECECIIGEPFYGSQQIAAPFVVWVNESAIGLLGKDVLMEDGPAGRLSVPWWHTRDDDMIQCSAEVMYEVTYDHREHWIRRVHHETILPSLVLSFWLSDTNDLVRIACCIEASHSAEIYEVLLCPFEFEPP